MSTVDPITPSSDDEATASLPGTARPTREPPPQPRVPSGGRVFAAADHESAPSPAGDPQAEG
jgi:hypothetical protein